MNSGKVTLRDIAKELNVSVATVSYVLNHSEKEKISHETRLKVLDTAKKMGYVPNLSARSLASKKSNLVGVIVNLGKRNSRCKRSRYYDLAGALELQLNKKGYETIMTITEELTEKEIEVGSRRLLEALFIIDFKEKYIRDITKNCYIPIIFMEGFLEKSFFYQIAPDYKRVLMEAKKYLKEENIFIICDEILNQKAIEYITQGINEEDILMSGSTKEIERFAKEHKGRKGIVIGEVLGVQVERFFRSEDLVVLTESKSESMLQSTTKKLMIDNTYKAEVAVDIMQQILNLTYNEQNDTRILLSPKIID